MSAHTPGDLVVEPETRHDHQQQTFKVVSLAEKKANEWRKDWYWPSVLHGLSREQADLFSAAPDLLAAGDLLSRRLDDWDRLKNPTPLIMQERWAAIDDAHAKLRAAIAKARGVK
jgi:hypothetical protein